MSRDANDTLDSVTAKGTWSVSAVTAGLLAVIISYAGPLAIFFQAAHAANVGNDVVASWVWSISMGAAVSGLTLSWLLKQPIITAWSAPDAASPSHVRAWQKDSKLPSRTMMSEVRS